jgi:ubiquitin C-terminal hydrolase
MEGLSAVSEADVIRNLSKSAPSAAGAMWCLVSAKWHASWEQYSQGQSSSRPESIDNSVLGEEQDAKKLKRGLLDMQDYALVPEPVWLKLVEWYGGGPRFARPMIEVGLKKRLVVEVYPMHLRVSERRNAAHDRLIQVSKGATGATLLSEACRALYMAPRRCMVWRLGSEGYEELPLHGLLSKCGVDEGAELIVEESLPDGAFESAPPVWVRPKNQNAMFRDAMRDRGATSAPVVRAVDSDQRAPERGVTGLVNLGNTCFMNSSLQCVTACAALRAFLSSDKYEGQINRNNPLGMGGRIAKAMALLVQRMWAEDNVVFVVPRGVKEVISDFAPQFEGYRQHDAQEFLAFLLDGLHEDLNQVKQKQMVATENAVGLEDAVAAKQAWERHLLRNRSEIVSLFHGQMRSRLVCPSCAQVSVTFDPFSVLSLPLPRSGTRGVQVTYVPLKVAGKSVEQLTVQVNRAGTVRDLCEEVGKAVGAKPERLFVAELYQKSVYKEYASSAEVASIGPNDDLFAFEVEQENDCKSSKKTSKEGLTVWKLGTVVTFSLILRKEPDLALFGSPLVFSLPVEGLTRDKVRAKVKELLGMHCTDSATFAVCLVSKSGKNCSYCGDSLCRGCEVTDEMLKKGAKTSGKEAVLKPRMNLGCNLPLEVEFATTRRVRADPAAAAAKAKKSISLDDCMNRFLEPETLSDSDAWFCPGCRAHVQAEKQIGLWSLPPVLVVHLKRFAFLSNRYREKLEDRVEYPLDGLDMGRFMLPGAPGRSALVYDLFAVSNHMGGLGGGHYTAYARPNADWWLFNDESCSRVQESATIVSPNSYILFYARRK